MTNSEAEYQQRKRDFVAALAELDVKLDEQKIEEHMRRIQARAQEHEVPMDEIMRQNVVRELFGNQEEKDD